MDGDPMDTGDNESLHSAQSGSLFDDEEILIAEAPELPRLEAQEIILIDSSSPDRLVPEAATEEIVPSDAAAPGRHGTLAEAEGGDITDADADDEDDAVVEADTDETESELQDLDDASSIQSVSSVGSRPLTPALLERPGNPSPADRPPTPRPLSELGTPALLNTSAAEFRSPKKVKASVVAKAAAKAAEAGPAGDDDDEDAECCPICFESWNNSGTHRLASLKCGHLFGQSCIEKWLKGQGGKCPQCNAKAHRKDVRVIYAKAIRTTDTSERDQALKDLETEKAARKKAEMDAAQAKLLHQVALNECKRLKEELERQKQQLQHSNLPNSIYQAAGSLSSQATSVSLTAGNHCFHLERSIKIWEAGGCRVMAYTEHLATLCVSQPSASPLFPGFGIKKLSTLDFKTAQYVSIHSKPIRDLAFNPASPDGLLLSCSLDKTVKMTSVTSNTVVQTYTCPMPLWSCAWNLDDQHYFYGGQCNGVVCVFDVRNTSEAVEQINTAGSRSPIVSLQYVPRNMEHAFRPGGLLVAQLDRTTFYEKTNDTYKCHALPLDAAMMSLSLDAETRHILSSHRPSARSPSVRHQMYEMTYTNTSADVMEPDMTCSCSPVQTFYGGSTAKNLSRTRLLPHPTDYTRLLVAAGDEASQSVHIWDTGDGQLKQKLRVSAPVLDICPISVNDQKFLAALTEKQVALFLWR